jgi:hypothetical protein
MDEVIKNVSSSNSVRGGQDTTLSIIIVSYNTKQVTDECIASIYAADWRDSFEVIVVDNNSQDGSVEMIRTKYPEVKLIVNPDNKLFAIANNQGAKIAKGKYLLLLNSDTLVYDDNLQRMVDYFETLPQDIICIGPKVLSKDKSLQSCGQPMWGTLAEHFFHLTKLWRVFPPLLKIYPRIPHGDKETHVAGWVVGCAMMIRSDLYAKVGGLNEKIEFYGEEPEFGYRTAKLGYKTIFYNGAELIHLGGVSTKNQEPKTEEDKEAAFIKSMHRFEKLVKETCGYKRAISICKITIAAYSLLRIISSNKQYFTGAIQHERKVIAYLKQAQLA